MLSDTHCHLTYIIQKLQNKSEELSVFITDMCKKNMSFMLDIGIDADDLLPRRTLIEKTICQYAGKSAWDDMRSRLWFAAGVWPHADAIIDRNNQLTLLDKSITKVQESGGAVIALGECGIDRYWNGEKRFERHDIDLAIFQEWEREFFQMQLGFARDKNLPFIVHSRDAFSETYDCIKNMGYYSGVIHCFSYGLEEAKKFLDLGLYISLSGAVTYVKKANYTQMAELIRYIPADRLLLETDAPYLAPVPYRGTLNTPLLVQHVYEFIAPIRDLSVDLLSDLVFKNACTLFKLSSYGQ